MIRRTGAAPPSMRVPELADLGDLYTTDPDEQRLGCDHISLQTSAEHLARLFRSVVAWLADADAETAQLARREFLSQLSSHARCARAKTLFARFRTRLDASLVDRGVKTDVARKLAGDSALIGALAELIWTLKNPRREFERKVGSTSVKVFCDEIEKWLREPDLRLFRPRRAPDENAIRRTMVTFFAAIKASVHLLKHELALVARCTSPSQIIVQGAGDIGMNYGKLAYQLAPDGRGRIVKSDGEPIEEREYTCLLSFKPNCDCLIENLCAEGLQTAGRLAIARVRFNQFSSPHQKVKLISTSKPHFIGDSIEYALTGPCIARDGHVVEPREIAHLFSDRRHLVNMPNLNPDPCWIEEKKIDIGKMRKRAKEVFKLQGLPAAVQDLNCPGFDPPNDPISVPTERVQRTLFGSPQVHDIWLGESVFIKNPDLFSAACEHPVEMELSALGAPIDWITTCLLAWEYNPEPSRDQVTKKGDFTWEFLDPSNPKLVWFPKAAQYPCTLVGIGSLHELRHGQSHSMLDVKRDGDLFSLAWGHSFDQNRGYTLFEASEVLCSLGARDVLVIDEGRDVFQYFFPDLPSMKSYTRGGPQTAGFFGVPPCRGRESIRGTVCFWLDHRSTELDRLSRFPAKDVASTAPQVAIRRRASPSHPPVSPGFFG